MTSKLIRTVIFAALTLSVSGCTKVSVAHQVDSTISTRSKAGFTEAIEDVPHAIAETTQTEDRFLRFWTNSDDFVDPISVIDPDIIHGQYKLPPPPQERLRN